MLGKPSKKKQAEKLKSREMKEGWMKNDGGWMKNDEGWKMNDEGWWFQAVEWFCFRTDERTNKRTDICDSRVAFATEKWYLVEEKAQKMLILTSWELQSVP